MTDAEKPKRRVRKPAQRLSPKQERFCHAYLVNLDPGEAAKKAGYSPAGNYAKSGHDLLQVHAVKKRIAELMENRNRRTDINADWMLKRLAEEVNADIADLYDADGNVRPISEWPDIWRKGLVAGIDITDFKGVKTVSIRLSDRVKRLEMIGKHINVGAFRENVAHTGKDGGPIEVIRPDMTPEEASRLYLERLKATT